MYQRALKLLYVDALLERIRADFAKQYVPKRYDYANFEELFRSAWIMGLCLRAHQVQDIAGVSPSACAAAALTCQRSEPSMLLGKRWPICTPRFEPQLLACMQAHTTHAL